MKVIIVGAGIGGLTTALMLHARGVDCEIYEQSEAIRELGVGINTLPHSIRELSELGLLNRLEFGRHSYQRANLRESVRPGNLARTSGHRRWLRRPSIFYSSRSLASGHLSGR